MKRREASGLGAAVEKDIDRGCNFGVWEEICVRGSYDSNERYLGIQLEEVKGEEGNSKKEVE